ncbi:hypothetical protein MKJ01_05710 [Chryseobacterium sp. SSA4.19]|uniref:hypothetical protein n=1 Tax=Chryseobacterium sp. SSA4.19 TaxID=2919915 RepID=UPI001F4D7A4D|nr:hypothetical protein [Chryseobacterium sp. SSA4.19]MCJ8153257.1 hypothetical protein [Chryseobacterium sp. SSA4.19]
MKKILILIFLSSLFLGCRTKHKAVTVTKEAKTEIQRVNLDSLKETSSKQETKKVIDKTIQEKKDEFSGDIIIKGKSDSLNPLEFHNVINGDTLQSISIRGNADYIINNRFNKMDKSKSESGKEESTNVIQQTARDLVSKETIKDVASTVMTKAKEVSEKGFTFDVWAIALIVGVVVLLLVFVYFYFRKSTWFMKIFNKK